MKKLARLSPETRAIKAVEEVNRDAGERRIQPRASIRVPLRLRIPSVDFPFESEAINISQSGVFVACEELPPLGTEVDLEISLEAGSLLLHATGKVVRHQELRAPRGIGVHFEEISYEAQALIDRMVADQRLFGDYRLEALIGQGGMAEVYAAKALDGPRAGQIVAVKRILPELASDRQMLELFEREAQVTAGLSHPLVVEVFDVGTVGDTLYIAMEFVRGCNLSRILQACESRQIQIPIDFGLYVAKTVAEALAYAHDARGPDGERLGIVHRDVTPGNVFISDVGEIKLGDFGVVHLGTLEDDRAVVGKEPYVAAEIIEEGRALPASDIFSLCAVLYELLTNRLAFPGESQDEIWRKIRAGEVEPPSALRPEIPAEVDALVLRGLSPFVDGISPGLGRRLKALFGDRKPKRFNTARELADAIEPLYDPAIGTQMAIAAVVRSILKLEG